MKKVRTLLSAFLPVVVSLALQIAVAFILSFWYTVVVTFLTISKGNTDPMQLIAELPQLLLSPLFNDILMIITFLASTTVFLIWYRKQKEKTVPAALNEVFCIRNLIIFVIAGITTQIAISMCLSLLLPLFPETNANYQALIESLIGGNAVIAAVSTAILAPITEEIIFRELMTKKLCKLFPFWLVNIIQAAVFGIYHLNIVQAVYAFVLGLLLGYVAYRLKSIWASIMLHGAINASALILDLILPESLMESMTGMIILAILCGTITILLALLFRIPKTGVTDTVMCAEAATTVAVETLNTIPSDGTEKE